MIYQIDFFLNSETTKYVELRNPWDFKRLITIDGRRYDFSCLNKKTKLVLVITDIDYLNL